MDDPRLLRKAKTPLFLDDEDSPLLELLRDMFIEGNAEYNIKELAAELGMSVFSLYKKFGGDRVLRATTLLHIINFVYEKNPGDTRLVDFLCEPIGYTAMPNNPKVDGKAVRSILMMAHDWTKKERKR